MYRPFGAANRLPQRGDRLPQRGGPRARSSFSNDHSVSLDATAFEGDLDPYPMAAAVLKRTLRDAGFEVFRTRGNEVVLAERPRENLIMDSGVRLRGGPPFEVLIVFSAQRAHFPHDDDPQLFERARRLAAPALDTGFTEATSTISSVTDPGDSERTLDTFYELSVAKTLGNLDDAFDAIRFALGLEKRA